MYGSGSVRYRRSEEQPKSPDKAVKSDLSRTDLACDTPSSGPDVKMPFESTFQILPSRSRTFGAESSPPPGQGREAEHAWHGMAWHGVVRWGCLPFSVFCFRSTVARRPWRSSSGSNTCIVKKRRGRRRRKRKREKKKPRRQLCDSLFLGLAASTHAMPMHTLHYTTLHHTRT